MSIVERDKSILQKVLIDLVIGLYDSIEMQAFNFSLTCCILGIKIFGQLGMSILIILSTQMNIDAPVTDVFTGRLEHRGILVST